MFSWFSKSGSTTPSHAASAPAIMSGGDPGRKVERKNSKEKLTPKERYELGAKFYHGTGGTAKDMSKALECLREVKKVKGGGDVYRKAQQLLVKAYVERKEYKEAIACMQLLTPELLKQVESEILKVFEGRAKVHGDEDRKAIFVALAERRGKAIIEEHKNDGKLNRVEAWTALKQAMGALKDLYGKHTDGSVFLIAVESKLSEKKDGKYGSLIEQMYTELEALYQTVHVSR